MKSPVLIVLIMALLPFGIFAQETASTDAQTTPIEQDTLKKFALVIGNGNYINLTPLANPVNDAEDISDVLSQLGFTVDKILNGNLEQMEDAAIRLREKLSEAGNAYGFFFYAGHGVQSGGENYLIPVNANIPGENFLRNRAMSVQQVLDDLNDARNKLNIVVLDACRDNPFGWSRGGSRGLSVVTRQPSDSIVVYATSAGQKASDGEGRNGLFTSQLLKNLATAGLEVSEVFKRTGADVAEISSNKQIPAIYTQFFKTAYLGAPPSAGEIPPVYIPGTYRPELLPPPAKKERSPKEASRFWSVGASVGSSFAEPWLIGILQGTIAPFSNSFLELGIDFGFLSGERDVGYYSFCPFAHLAYFMPFKERGGFYAGAGAGYFVARYSFDSADLHKTTLAADFIAGINLFDMLNISYTLRTNFRNLSNKAAIGYTYRFK